MLHQAGIQVILDHHALPGVATPDQMFAGNCTNNVQFYVCALSFVQGGLELMSCTQTSPNYGRALVWPAGMTKLSHLETDFKSVFSIQAVNEPIQDANQTPGLQN